MATRNIKLLGTAYSTSGDVSITVNFNGSQVFSGTVPTTNSTPPAKEISNSTELATWTTTTDVTGSIPLSIAVSGGTLNFQDLTGDQIVVLKEDENGNRVVENGAYVVLTNVTDFTLMNTNTEVSDGKSNVQIDGENQPRDLASYPGETGEWMYPVDDGETLTLNFYIDPNLLTSVPTPA